MQKICLSYSPPPCVFHSCVITHVNHSWHVFVNKMGGESAKRMQTCRQEVALICPKMSSALALVGYITSFFNCSPRYSNEGRVTNITLPTGEVSGFHSNLERWSRVEVEASTRNNFVTSTNLSAGDTIYTFRQGTMVWWHVGKVTPEPPDIRACQGLHMHTSVRLWFMCDGGATGVGNMCECLPTLRLF